MQIGTLCGLGFGRKRERLGSDENGTTAGKRTEIVSRQDSDARTRAGADKRDRGV
jgi:hypothetical protein